ncbi:hypothetical protein DV515_00012945 [Chloebia gouldiae]|uniref:Uncharacterized protein n=1 Tax=Chloebia gouldiae TaxID=44316 RepID=A0A3L8S3E0_CHLGU|nr:hypothetical protein DV515_00012945 [Chloebia gouldiae]
MDDASTIKCLSPEKEMPIKIVRRTFGEEKKTITMAINACFQSSSDMDISKSPLLQNKFSVARLAEDFFWVGGSIVASPRWKIGHFVSVVL